MDVNTVKYGLNAVKNRANIVEVLVHPCYYRDENVRNNQHYKEFLVFVNDKLKKEIENQGWIIQK